LTRNEDMIRRGQQDLVQHELERGAAEPVEQRVRRIARLGSVEIVLGARVPKPINEPQAEHARGNERDHSGDEHVLDLHDAVTLRAQQAEQLEVMEDSQYVLSKAPRQRRTGIRRTNEGDTARAARHVRARARRLALHHPVDAVPPFRKLLAVQDGDVDTLRRERIAREQKDANAPCARLVLSAADTVRGDVVCCHRPTSAPVRNPRGQGACHGWTNSSATRYARRRYRIASSTCCDAWISISRYSRPFSLAR